jgi:hypothetical protein
MPSVVTVLIVADSHKAVLEAASLPTTVLCCLRSHPLGGKRSKNKDLAELSLFRHAASQRASVGTSGLLYRPRSAQPFETTQGSSKRHPIGVKVFLTQVMILDSPQADPAEIRLA